MSTTSISANMNNVPMLNGMNFKDWKENILIVLGCMDIDLGGIPEVFRGAITEDVTVASEFLLEIQKRFAKNDKAKTSTLLASLISMKYKGKGNVREYIMEMSHLASKLKALKLDLSNDLLVHLVLISLPTQFNQFKVWRSGSDLKRVLVSDNDAVLAKIKTSLQFVDRSNL
ncbi:uncharacterized protein LOC114321869 [Camellia sinensis]|uniref:uncharacterized protein LOC114321869 n=1 Tax=Camellia sinensis TaxID=4442 RepID=UPI0010360A5A|nr:uncharacterized protein LOC114321869 [Camellia sinensis]